MVRRVLAVGSIGASGLALVAGSVVGLAAASGPAALVLCGLGAVLGLALVAGAAYVYRSDVRTSHTVRVAGWNALGAVLLGSVLALAVFGAGVSVPLFLVVDVLGVSAVAHVLIGYNDVRRIRAEELARQRRALAVVNRVTRHNLRNDTQVLSARAEQLVDGVDDPDLRDAAEAVREKSLELATIHERLQAFQTALDDPPPETTLELDAVVERVLADYRDAHPDGRFDVDVPEGATVRADGQLETALDNLVENAIRHGSPGDVFVRVSATLADDSVTLTVTDRGPGIPEGEKAILAGERDIDQLEHASGLGLWVVKAVVERHDGELSFPTDAEGAAVALSLPRA